MMQAPIPQELSALMALKSGMQRGSVAPTTPDGMPTMAMQEVAQAEQQMAPPRMGGMMPGQPMMPGVRGAAERAGIAGQIRNMQMQEAQKAILNQAMAQQQNPGIEGLNPNIRGYADGGIVGYAAGNLAQDVSSIDVGPEFGGASAPQEEIRLRVPGPKGERMMTPTEMLREGYPETYIQRRLESEGFVSRPAAQTPATVAPAPAPEAAPAPAPAAPAAPAPAPVGAPSAAKPSGVEALFKQQREAYGKMKPESASAEEIAARRAKDDPVYRQYLISQGIDPDALAKRVEEDKALFQAQRDLLRQRMAREEGKDTFLGRIGEAARGFKQLRGQGIGAGLLSSEEALSRRVGASEAAMDQMRDTELKINELEITRRRALEDQRRAVAEGDWARAASAIATERKAANEITKLQADTYGKQATAMLEERKIAEMAASRHSGQQAQEFARLQGIASAHESRKAVELRKLDEDFAKQNATLLNIEKFGGLKPEQKKELEAARFAHERQKAVVAKDYDDRINMINSRLYPGIDFSSKSSAGASSADIEAARKIVSGGK